jgi:hypothetical protein
MSDDYVDRMVRRRVGLDALRRLQRLVDAERVREASEARLAQRLAVGIVVLAGLTLLYLLSR